MKIKIREESNINKIKPDLNWDYSFYQKSFDQRGIEATEFIKKHSDICLEIEYNYEDMVVSIDGRLTNIDEIDSKLSFLNGKSVILEATTLSFVELLLLIKFTVSNDITVDILYLEPKSYSKKRTESGGMLHSREFELSGITPGFIPIPGFTNSFGQHNTRKTIFIAGYESERIERCIQENSLNGSDCSIIFGVPAFKVGWEMNSFANNIQLIKSHRINNIYYSCANNPCSTLDLLYWIENSLDSDEEIYIAPVGPKPAGIATAIFAAKSDKVNIFYDHPKKKQVRTEEIGNWHIYSINFDRK